MAVSVDRRGVFVTGGGSEEAVMGPTGEGRGVAGTNTSWGASMTGWRRNGSTVMGEGEKGCCSRVTATITSWTGKDGGCGQSVAERPFAGRRVGAVVVDVELVVVVGGQPRSRNEFNFFSTKKHCEKKKKTLITAIGQLCERCLCVVAMHGDDDGDELVKCGVAS